MKKTLLIITLGLALSGLQSCIKEDKDKNCLGSLARLRIELEWVQTDPRDNEEQVQLAVVPTDFGEPQINLTSDIYGRDVELSPDTYRIVGWEPAENITITGDTVTVALDPGDEHVRIPQAFSGGATTARVYAQDEDQVIPLPMRRQTRPLCIRVYFTGEGAPVVASLEAELEGVTIERNINNAFPPADGRVRPPAIRNGLAHYSFSWTTDHWFATKRLIGVDGDAAQRLHFEVTFADGESDNIALDVTGDMLGYHIEDVVNNWCLTIYLDLTELLILSITDWYAGAEIPLVAD